jgi:hypothetical protein
MRCTRKNTRVLSSLYTPPPKAAFIETISPSPNFALYHLDGKTTCIEAYRIDIQESQLANHLEIY